MAHIRQTTPEGLEELVDYFDATYVSGTCRTIRRPTAASDSAIRLIVRRVPPLYPVDIWSVHESMLLSRNRTNNLCESWNNGLYQLVGHYHPSVWTLIEALRQDSAVAETDIAHNQRGHPPKKRVKRSTIQLQERLQQICRDRVNKVKSVEQTLNAAAHTIRFYSASA